MAVSRPLLTEPAHNQQPHSPSTTLCSIQASGSCPTFADSQAGMVLFDIFLPPKTKKKLRPSTPNLS